MSVLAGVFDRSGTLKRPSIRRLASEAFNFLTYHPDRPDVADMPDGAAHRVLIVPALMTTDVFTAPLRKFLNQCGYQAEGWGLGFDVGPTPRAVDGLRRVLDRMCDEEQGPVRLAGVSMGGILARNLAQNCPDQVSHLVSIVSPTRFPTASHAEHLIRLISPSYSDELEPARYNEPLAMPSLAIHSRDDGIIAWESCVGREDKTVSLEVFGAHAAICRNPDVLRAVAKFLAPEANGK